jgi:RNA methyltransferase, TrmH family
MASPLGNRAERLTRVRSLRTVKGRRETRRFAFEGPTLLAEALASGFPIEELYATQAAYEASSLLRDLEAAGTPTFLVEGAAAAAISDVTTPSGVVAVAPVRLTGIEELFRLGSPVLVLADVNDPANAGTLLRSADAFGCAGVVFGALGVDPYHPKVVRGSMGAVFRLPLAVGDAAQVGRGAAAAGARLVGLTAHGTPLAAERWTHPFGLIVGNERRGLGAWQSLCERTLAIPMTGPIESLSAGVAGSIALYEARRADPCQDSPPGVKSQDYRG